MAHNGNVFPDPFALAKAQNDDSTKVPGLKCEVKVYEARFNSKGERVPLQVGVERAVKPPIDKDHDSALVLTRFYKRDRDLDSLDDTELEIKSPHIKTALREVIGEYPGIDLNASKVVIKDLPKCFFHYYSELNSYGCALEDPIAVQHLVFALEYMFRTLQNQLVSYYNFIESPSGTQGLEFVNLWMVYRPGDLIYVKGEEVDWAGRLKSMSRCACLKKNCWQSRWILDLEIIDFDGKKLGHRERCVTIQPYDSHKKLQDLRAFPFQYHPDANLKKEMLVARGEKFISLAGVHHRSFSGKAATPYDNVPDDDDSLWVTSVGRCHSKQNNPRSLLLQRSQVGS